MKARFLFLFLFFTAAVVRAQGLAADTAFRFNHRISRVVNQWVALPKVSGTDQYPFGFVYIDPTDGFVFNLEGFMTVDGNGKFTRNKKKLDEQTRQNYMLKPGPKPLVAVISADHNEELDIYPRPDWLESYNAYTDTTAHYVQWAKAYNGIQDPEMAVAILTEPYKLTPHFDGLELELANAYLALQRYNEAVNVMTGAIAKDPKNVSFYKELGNAYLSKGAFDKVIETCKTGIALCQPGDNVEKSQMAMYTALAYRGKGDKGGYSSWLQYAKLWAPKKSEIADVLNNM